MALLFAAQVANTSITGSVEQLLHAMHALEIKLGPDVLAKLNQIFPGPGAPAPEAYAW